MKTIVIGAGAAGLMAAWELSKKGVEVMVLESEDRIGGRAHTYIPDGFSHPIEAGAEFIHGKLPLTLGLLKKAKLGYVEASMNMTAFGNGEFHHGFGSPYWGEFAECASNLKRDCTLSEFLDRYFSEQEYADFRYECEQMAQGLDLADPKKLSMFCIRDEWTSEDTQFRTVSGYSALFDFIADSISDKGGKIHLAQKVTRLDWKPGIVKVTTDSGTFYADKAIVTTTLGNLQNQTITISPKIDTSLFDQIGFGEVLKIVMEFEFPFWEETQPDLGFLFTEEAFTFWTQLDLRRPILVGWIGNDRASEMARLQNDVLVGQLLSKLDEAFPKTQVKKILRAKAVFRYTKGQGSHGGYSWTMPESRKAIAEINKGIGNTLWFAGEAFERTGDVATVEAAFKSGRYTARKILRSV